jgi:cell wall-associated NlpC family hydrolase
VYLKLGTLTLAVLVSFIPGSMANAVVPGSFSNSDSIWWNPSARTAMTVQFSVASDKAEMAKIERDSYRIVRVERGHSYDLDKMVWGDRVFDTALNYIGTPYSYSGVGPEYFDCSGFTRFVLAKHGIHLEHSATKQRNSGKVIPESEARLGDIVWMPGHVGFWAGNGLMLDSLKPGTRVDIRKIWTSSYKVIRFDR